MRVAVAVAVAAAGVTRNHHQGQHKQYPQLCQQYHSPCGQQQQQRNRPTRWVVLTAPVQGTTREGRNESNSLMAVRGALVLVLVQVLEQGLEMMAIFPIILSTSHPTVVKRQRQGRGQRLQQQEALPPFPVHQEAKTTTGYSCECVSLTLTPICR